MLDYSRIEQYRENNRIEAKKAAGGLPRSIWDIQTLTEFVCVREQLPSTPLKFCLCKTKMRTAVLP